MNQSFEFCDERANIAAKAAASATLANVRDRELRAEKTWRRLADQARRVAQDRAKAEAERDLRRQAETDPDKALAEQRVQAVSRQSREL
jgi:hypothetical protein